MDTPRLLLVEDDATSRAVLSEVLRSLPAMLDVACDCTDARRLAGAGRHALWLLDLELPDGDGIGLLADLRALDPQCPALAHTASDDPALHTRLADSGFLGVIRKPVAADALLAQVRDVLAGHPRDRTAACHPVVNADTDATHATQMPDWDDAAACRALGNPAHVPVLRAQFLASLAQESALVEAACAAGDHSALRAVLHRLRAACGFTGAARLDACVRTLRAATTPAETSAALHEYRAACNALHRIP